MVGSKHKGCLEIFNPGAFHDGLFCADFHVLGFPTVSTFKMRGHEVVERRRHGGCSARPLL